MKIEINIYIEEGSELIGSYNNESVKKITVSSEEDYPLFGNYVPSMQEFTKKAKAIREFNIEFLPGTGDSEQILISQLLINSIKTNGEEINQFPEKLFLIDLAYKNEAIYMDGDNTKFFENARIDIYLNDIEFHQPAGTNHYIFKEDYPVELLESKFVK